MLTPWTGSPSHACQGETRMLPASLEASCSRRAPSAAPRWYKNCSSLSPCLRLEPCTWVTHESCACRPGYRSNAYNPLEWSYLWRSISQKEPGRLIDRPLPRHQTRRRTSHDKSRHMIDRHALRVLQALPLPSSYALSSSSLPCSSSAHRREGGNFVLSIVKE